MAFSYDGRCLACLTEAPEYKLVFIDLYASTKKMPKWERKKDENTHPITRISIAPHDNHLGIFLFFYNYLLLLLCQIKILTIYYQFYYNCYGIYELFKG